VAFLQEANQDKFNNALMSVKEDRGPKCIFDMKTLTGEIETEKRERAEKFTGNIYEFTKQYELISA